MENLSYPTIMKQNEDRRVENSVSKETLGPVQDVAPYRSDQAFEIARGIDEEYISLWLDHEQARHQYGALKWLQDRDFRRRGTTVSPTLFLQSLLIQLVVAKTSYTSQSLAVLNDEGSSKRVKFMPPIDLTSSRSKLRSRKQIPTFDIKSNSSSDFDFLQRLKFNRAPETDNDPLVVYQDSSNRMYTAGGREILLVAKPSLGHKFKFKSNEKARTINDGGVKSMPFSMSGALQPKSGNAGLEVESMSYRGRARNERGGNSFQEPQQSHNHNQSHANNNPSWGGTANDSASSQGEIQGSDGKIHSTPGLSAGLGWNKGPVNDGGRKSNVQAQNGDVGWGIGGTDDRSRNAGNGGTDKMGSGDRNQSKSGWDPDDTGWDQGKKDTEASGWGNNAHGQGKTGWGQTNKNVFGGNKKEDDLGDSKQDDPETNSREARGGQRNNQSMGRKSQKGQAGNNYACRNHPKNNYSSNGGQHQSMNVLDRAGAGSPINDKMHNSSPNLNTKTHRSSRSQEDRSALNHDNVTW